jgi:hypothetical protein
MSPTKCYCEALYYEKSVFTYIAFTLHKIFIASLVQAMAQQSTRFDVLIEPYVTRSGAAKRQIAS